MHFTARGGRINAANGQVELILVFHPIFCARQVSISWLETLPLGIDGSEL